jgi:drug/metabolite transporter (DMT)-like permease
MLTALAVLVRIVANPAANVFQKQLTQRAAHPLVVIGATHALLTLATLPFLSRLAWSDIDPAFWSNISASAALAVGGNVLLVAALSTADLSVLGPINAYKPVLSLAPGLVLLGEVPNAVGAAGLALIVAGSALIVDRDAGQAHAKAVVRFLRERGIQLRFAALVCSATEAVFLKRAELHASPTIAFVCWVLLGLPLAAVASMLVIRRELVPQLELMRHAWSTYALLAVAIGVMQLATLFSLERLPVGYCLALFQLSALVSVVLGARYFAERGVGRRLLGSGVMIAGAVLIITLGRGT